MISSVALGLIRYASGPLSVVHCQLSSIGSCLQSAVVFNRQLPPVNGPS
jgi:hypothetical protein